jgi:ATP-dependent Lhr-like helicase
VDETAFARVLDFVATGGYSLRAYDRFADRARRRHLAADAPEQAARHRLNAGIIVDSKCSKCAFATGARWARWKSISARS